MPPDLSPPDVADRETPPEASPPDSSGDGPPPDVAKPETPPETSPPDVADRETPPEASPPDSSDDGPPPDVADRETPPEASPPDSSGDGPPPDVAEPETPPETSPPDVADRETPPEASPPDSSGDGPPPDVAEPETPPETSPPDVADRETPPEASPPDSSGDGPPPDVAGPETPPETSPPDVADRETPPEASPPSSVLPDPIPPTGQVFRGENALEAKLSGLTLDGTVLVIDQTCGARFSTHCAEVTALMTGAGVPAGNIVGDAGLGRFTPGAPSTYWSTKLRSDSAYATLAGDLKVVVMPIRWAFIEPGVARTVGGSNVVFVAAAGNTEIDQESGHPIPEQRDIYTRGHAEWSEVDAYGWFLLRRHSTYQETMNTLRTGKAILATWGDVDSQGEISPHTRAVKCGDAMDWCFTVILPPRHRNTDPELRIATGTSFAAPHLGTAAYYLFQLWDRAEDVVSTLKACAIDVGEPGVDREFGVGVLNVDCPEVANMEIVEAVASVRAQMRSPFMDLQGQSGSQAPSASGPALGFNRDGTERHVRGLVPRIYLSDRYRALGLSVPYALGAVTGILGYGMSPLGVSSTIAPTTESPFFEIGFETDILRSEVDDETHRLLLLVGAYGASNDQIDASAARLGLRYEEKVSDSSLLSLYAGVLRAGADVGIPGRREVGRDRVPISRDGVETRLQFRFAF